MAITQIPGPIDPAAGFCDSQTHQWLRQGFTPPPQVRLVFGEESPNWSTREKMLWTGKTLRRGAVNDD
jgi:hypothetical protein